VNLVLVEKEFTGPKRLVIPGAARAILSDVSVDQPGSAGLKIDESIADVRFPFTQGFDLCAVKDHAGFVFLQQVVVVGGGAVLGDDLLFLFTFGFVGLLGWLGHSLILGDTDVKC
jgi:hypothetical protein